MSSPPLRAFLLANGLRPRDIAEAVDEARHFTRRAKNWAEVAEHVLAKAAAHPKLGKRTRSAVVYGVKVAGAIERGAAEMLRKRGLP